MAIIDPAPLTRTGDELGYAEERILRQRAVLQAINRLFKEALAFETQGELARASLEIAQELTGSRLGFIGLINEAGRLDTIAMSDMGWEECRMAKTQAVKMIHDMEIRGIWGKVIKGQTFILTNDPGAYMGWAESPEGHPRISRFLGLPLKHKDQTIGMIGLANKESGYTLADEQDMEAFSVAFVEARQRKQADESRKDSEKKYRDLVDNAQIGIYQTSLKGDILFVNTFLARMLEFESPAEMMSRGVLERYQNPRDREVLIERLEREGKVSDFELELLTKKGKRKIALLNGTLNGDVMSGMISDISGHRQAEEQIHRQVERMNALRHIDMAISSSLDIRVTLNIFLDHVTTQLRIDAATVLLLNRDSHALEFAAEHGLQSGALRHTHLRLGEGLAGVAALERRIIRIPNLQEAEDCFRRSPLFSGEKFVAYFGVPLLAKGQVKGVLEIFHRSPLDPDQEWMGFLEALAGQAAIAIDNASLFDELQRSNLELTLAYDITLEGWSKALDLRDRETEGHTLRVTEMTVELGRILGLAEAELVQARRGALLHDIGKMGIPDRILLKPGPLTEEEWDIMRKHPVLAHEWLSPIAFLHPAIDVPYCHHEKWDGSGYPRGLRGDEIPIAARIFSVVDVWDALRSERTYRQAWPEEKAREHLRQQAGRQFDPKVVELFLERQW